MRRVIRPLMVMCAVTSLATGCNIGKTRTVAENVDELSSNGAQSVAITLQAGDLTVAPTEEPVVSTRVVVTSIKTNGGEDPNARSAATPTLSLSNGVLTVDGRWELPSLYGTSTFVDAPPALSLAVTDGSGGITIADWQSAVTIVDGSGDITVSGSAAAEAGVVLSITDGSGDITVTDWKGHVEIVDGSGDVTLDNVLSHNIEQDSSGDVTIVGKSRDLSGT